MSDLQNTLRDRGIVFTGMRKVELIKLISFSAACAILRKAEIRWASPCTCFGLGKGTNVTPFILGRYSYLESLLQLPPTQLFVQLILTTSQNPNIHKVSLLKLKPVENIFFELLLPLTCSNTKYKGRRSRISDPHFSFLRIGIRLIASCFITWVLLYVTHQPKTVSSR